MKNKLVFAFAAIASLVLAAGPAAAQAAPNNNYGTFQIQVDLGTPSPDVEPIVDPAYAGEAKNFVLSDDNHEGTFKAKFKLRALNTPDFDTFTVTNTTNEDKVFGYVHEDQNIQPHNPNRNMSELLACFNVLCDTNVYFPSGVLTPPVPLGVVPANSTVEFKVGMKLSALANAAAWDGTTLMTTLYFQTMP